MQTMKINVLNPKAAQLLKDLADMDLISIEEPEENQFTSALQKLRSEASSAPTLEEITKEVELARLERYAR